MNLYVASCRDCGTAMRLNRNRQSGELFLGCRDYPRCSYSENYDDVLAELLAENAALRGKLSIGPDSASPLNQRQALADQLKALVFRFHADRNPGGIPGDVVTRELIRLRSELLEAAA